ncbi:MULTISPECIES: Crp/Fnr family transcriptional regulator [unclassified Polaromonas]|jgi:CRP-like cAMP-binding protein|uniref:Crp/Fnr family transcriptional regulator n=1 Tax=unclassified Polaromonas TaxID=2638319 RepID=UPI0018CAD49A|nr:MULTISPECIES: Crp/Fnr family transcriptional regulator [unclassified Polaromonas]MBG6073051.1 CRP-like cAMP-binding protein [Polaromonas sp. CG_9.7]MBG6115056.1 CRP-like cAMP-binding protein [Polaromonas sp. CG_9.2]MDH6186021.1 CRP-like cAMP-binding protein [Polaromonas sp. CG_23.6]
MTATMVSRLDLLRRVPLFSMLTTSQAVSVADAVVKRRYRKGELIVEQGQKSCALTILLTGRARVVSRDARGREVILATLRPGDFVGEMSLIDQAPHSASVIAELQTDTLVMDQLAFTRCLPDSDSMAYAMLKGLVHRLRQADRKIESLALMDVYGRVAGTLLDLAAEALPDADGAAMIHGRVSRQDVAKMVGASREMVSRVMKDLEERGFIETQDNGSLLVRPHLDSLV